MVQGSEFGSNSLLLQGLSSGSSEPEMGFVPDAGNEKGGSPCVRG
jgi:hypothetical protein